MRAPSSSSASSSAGITCVEVEWPEATPPLQFSVPSAAPAPPPPPPHSPAAPLLLVAAGAAGGGGGGALSARVYRSLPPTPPRRSTPGTGNPAPASGPAWSSLGRCSVPLELVPPPVVNLARPTGELRYAGTTDGPPPPPSAVVVGVPVWPPTIVNLAGGGGDATVTHHHHHRHHRHPLGTLWIEYTYPDPPPTRPRDRYSVILRDFSARGLGDVGAGRSGARGGGQGGGHEHDHAPTVDRPPGAATNPFIVFRCESERLQTSVETACRDPAWRDRPLLLRCDR
jgi:hypothetical protein